jgi:hypothetical protein
MERKINGNFTSKRFFVYNFFTSRNPELSGQFSSCGWSAGDSVSTIQAAVAKNFAVSGRLDIVISIILV